MPSYVINTLFQRFVLIGVILILICTSCDKSPEENLNKANTSKFETSSENNAEQEAASAKIESQWKQHIRVTPNWQSARAPIKIYFNHQVTKENNLERPLSGAISIKPNFDAITTFSATNELSISPSKPLTSGEKYSLTLHPQQLEGVANDLKPYEFSIQVIKQDYELHIDGLTPSGSSQMRLDGSIKTSDIADPSQIETSLEFTHFDKALEVHWHHAENQRDHRFYIEAIPRSQQSSFIKLQYSAESLGVEKFGKREIAVPALNKFEITGTQTSKNQGQSIEVKFSEALDSKQNLDGLVRINGEAVSTRIDGSVLRIYPREKIIGAATIDIDKTLRSSKNLALSKAFSKEVVFINEHPGVRFAKAGSIIPPAESINVPIEAINVNSVWVTAFEVYEKNIPDYLQGNPIVSGNTDSSAGRYLWRKKITLPAIPFDTWQRFDIDLNPLMEKHPQSIINLQVSIDKSNLAFSCSDDSPSTKENKLENYEGPDMEAVVQRPDWFQRYYSSDNGYYTYEYHHDPCHPGFYTYYDAKNISMERNFFISDIGLIVKKGDSLNTHVVTNSINRGTPLSGVKLKLFNYQHQLLASATSNKQGMATLKPKGPGFYLVAEHNEDKNYLRLPRNEALPTSQFDTRGEHVTKGLKGFIYGERDVWRPGDNIYLNFILEDNLNTLPDKHPVSLDFFDPRGNKLSTLTRSEAVGNIYSFELSTKEDSPTGNWRAVVRVGGEYFDKTIKVETITPNRLKIDLTPSKQPLLTYEDAISTELFAQWLHGATAKNLQAKAEIKLRPQKTEFKGYSQFIFDDPASGFKQFNQQIFDGSLNSQGKANFKFSLSAVENAPGKLNATFVTRVFEQSGNFSTTIRNAEVLPYKQWVGLNISEGSGYQGAIARDQDHPIQLIAINSDGKPLTKRKIQLNVYKIGWRWWWEQSNEDLSNYVRSSGNHSIEEATLVTDAKGLATWQLKKDKYDWGRHLIRVCDKQSGHCSGKEIYLGWSWSNQVNPDSATQLMLASDKERYQPGDIARITIPELAEGQMLYSLENGSELIEQKWLQLEPGARFFELPITDAMAPNVYLNVMLLLPHQGKSSDSPIRLYGMTSLGVDNPNKHLTPQLVLPESARPNSTFEVTVSEANNKKMHYTLAMVDEGLLGLTAYKTPNPNRTFNKREALGVLTWDMYDGVLGAYGANLERLLKIGGGDKGKDKKQDKERRFPPVVQFLGAFTLEAGASKKHEISLPQYMGAVRVMLVAANEGAYGKAESSVLVKQPLNLLATLPRVLGPAEKVSLPVNVFVSDAKIKQVKIKVLASDLFKVTRAEHTFTFNEPGDQIASLELLVLDKIGKGEVRVIATAGEEKAEQTIFIDIRSPNPASTISQTKTLPSGASWSPTLLPHGMKNTNQSSVTISSFPPLNLEKHMNYLIRYPHGCVEQTTSTVFPQIFLRHLVDLDQEQETEIESNVLAALNKYRSFQKSNGGFSYWPGTSYINTWSSIYATHFLLEAKALGYAVPNNLLQNAISYLKSLQLDASQDSIETVNAYRLLVLSRANAANVSEMNRLRESLMQNNNKTQHQLARWQLATAYQGMGLSDIATELMQVSSNDLNKTQFSQYTYGSELRNLAILLSAYNALQLNQQSWDTAKDIASLLSSDSWFSTHSLSWALLSLAQYANTAISDSGNRFAINENSQNNVDWQSIESLKTFYQQPLSAKTLAEKTLTIRNDGEKPLHIEVSNRGVPLQGKEHASSEGLSLEMAFYDNDGNKLDVNALPQGQDFYADITVRGANNKASWKQEDLALTLGVPSGWQIRNERLEGDSIPNGLDYQDIRDDAVRSYFSLWKNYHWYYRYNDNNRESQNIKIKLNASFAGKFYLPAWQVNAMYNEQISALVPGQWVEVIADKNNP